MSRLFYLFNLNIADSEPDNHIKFDEDYNNVWVPMEFVITADTPNNGTIETEPAETEPVVTEPVVTEPVVTEPVITPPSEDAVA